MHNYLLLLYAIHKTPSKVNFYGDGFDIKQKVMNLLKQPTENEHQLDIIYYESYNWLRHYWKNNYVKNNDVLIVCSSTNEAIVLFKEIRAYGTSYIYENFVFIENIHDNYHDLFRKQILLPVENVNIDSIFNWDYKGDVTKLEIISDIRLDQQILKTFVSDKPYIYIGTELDQKQYEKITSLMRFKFQIIECYMDPALEYRPVGVAFTKDFSDKALINHLRPFPSVQKFLEFDKIHLKIPVY